MFSFKIYCHLQQVETGFERSENTIRNKKKKSSKQSTCPVKVLMESKTVIVVMKRVWIIVGFTVNTFPKCLKTSWKNNLPKLIIIYIIIYVIIYITAIFLKQLKVLN